MGKFPQSRSLPKGQIHHNQLQGVTLRKGLRVPRRRVEEVGAKLQAYILPFTCSCWSYLTDISAVLNRILLRCCREYSQIHVMLNKSRLMLKTQGVEFLLCFGHSLHLYVRT